MAIAFDAKTQGSAGASPVTQTYAHTCTGSNLILYVHVFSVGIAGVVTGVTYNAVSMTLVDEQVSGSGSNATLFRLVNPASGSNNVVISYTAAAYGASVSTSYTGAKQSGGVFVKNKNTGNPSVTVVLTPNSSNNWIVMAVGADASAPTATNSAFLRQVGSNVAITAFDTNADVSGSTTMGASSDNLLYAVAESFEPAGAASTTLPFKALLGVGI